MRLRLTEAHQIITSTEKVGVGWATGAPQNWGFPFNTSAATEGSDFKIGRLVGV